MCVFEGIRFNCECHKFYFQNRREWPGPIMKVNEQMNDYFPQTSRRPYTFFLYHERPFQQSTPGVFTGASADNLQGHRFKVNQRCLRLNRLGAAISAKILRSWTKLPSFHINAPSAATSTNTLDSSLDMVASRFVTN